MAVDEVDAETSGLVPGAHRMIRMLDTGEGPYTGALVTSGESVLVRVDAEELHGWAGWVHAGSEHVAGPVDVARRADGQDALLPWCTERILAFLGRRAAADAALAAGETCTLVASLLRGLGELGDAGAEPLTGSWWLTDDGRPLFAIGAGADARAGALEIVGRLRDGQPERSLARLLAAVHDGLERGAGRPRMPQAQLDRWEAELLAIAAPRPLRRDVHAPERVRDIEALRAAGRRPVLSRREARVVRGDGEGAPLDRIRGFLSAGGASAGKAIGALRGRLARTGTSSQVPAGATKTVPRRRRTLLVAGASAAAVLAGGLLWPGGATGDPDGSSTAQTAAPIGGRDAPDATPSGRAAEKTPSAADDDPVAAAEGLLKLLAACTESGDELCADAVAPGSSGIAAALAGVLVEEPGRAVEIVDEYGDVAVIRLTAGGTDAAGGVEQMMVLVRQNEKWLVRDVYGVADQPG